jgi:hypothetical protein
LIEAQTQGKWKPAHLVGTRQAPMPNDGRMQVRWLGSPADKSEWLDKEQVRLWKVEGGKGDHLVILPGSQLPLLLGGSRGTTSFVLQQASPVLTGKLLDRASEQPVAGATISRADGKWHVNSASDGSFALHLDDPLVPLLTFVTKNPPAYMNHPSVRKPQEFTFLVGVDQSARMKSGQGSGSPAEAPAGQQWQDGLRKEAKRFFELYLSNQDTGRITLWSFAAAPSYKGAMAEPELVTEHLKNGRVNEVESVLAKLKPEGVAPLTAFVKKLVTLEQKKEIPANAVILLFSTGENASANQSAAEAYVAGKCLLPIHIFGLGVVADSKEEKELRSLALVSGGSLRLTDANKPYALPLRAFSARAGNVPVAISSSCYLPKTLAVPLAEAGLKAQQIGLDHQCQCQNKDRRLLTITQKNVADLAMCEGLSSSARRMIEERVKDPGWTVTIPSCRVNIGDVTAYGWFETETTSGRMIGRTEDGLHGSTPASGGWPKYNPYKSPLFKQAGSQLPFVAWYQGVVAYTAGSVVAAMKWHRQPGFLNGTPEDLKRFIQANALDFTAGWWDDVGAKSFPENAEFFWSGVCLNFALQSGALGLPSDDCLRRWAENLCNRAADSVKEKGKDLASGAVNQMLDQAFGSERAVLIQIAMQRGFPGLADDLNGMWGPGVDQGFICERFRGK